MQSAVYVESGMSSEMANAALINENGVVYSFHTWWMSYLYYRLQMSESQ